MKQVRDDLVLSSRYGVVSEKYVPTPLNSRALVELYKTVGEERGFAITTVAADGDLEVIGMWKETGSTLPYVYISAGIHGNEPAPPIAILKLLREGFFSDSVNWVICPVMNPYGLSKATRRNKEGFDLNRQYKDTVVPEIDSHIQFVKKFQHFDLTIACHEDHEANGFYLYERHGDEVTPIAQNILNAVSEVMPIETSHKVDGEHVVNGVIHSERFTEKKKHWPEMIFMNHHYPEGDHYTIETPSKLPLSQRVEAQKVAIEAAVKSL